MEPFIALSYVWGNPKDTRTIIVDDQNVSITVNLDSALRSIRDGRRIMRVWADAVCINQVDTAEKNNQVRLMGDIYSTARHTIIYLGGPGEADTGMDMILNEISALAVESEKATTQSSSSLGSLDTAAKARYFLSSVLKKPWFSRVWVLQELVMSKDPWVQFGTARISWNEFMKCVSVAPNLFSTQGHGFAATPMVPGSQLPSTISKDSDYTIMDKIRRIFRASLYPEEKTLDLFTLLTSRRGMGASNSRDLIYAHLGIATASREWKDSIEIDYNKSVGQIFAEAAYHCLVKENYNILDHIDDWDHLIRTPGLPTWAPDWSFVHAHPIPLQEKLAPRSRGER